MAPDLSLLEPLEEENRKLNEESDEHLERLREVRTKLQRKRTIPPPPDKQEVNPGNAG